MTDAFSVAQLQDIQGFGIAGFKKDHQQLMFFRFGDPASGRRFLGWLEAQTASAWEVGSFNQLFSEIKARTDGEEPICATWIGVLISAMGYQALGVGTTSLPAGEGTNAFTAGMANRSQQTGDTGPLDVPSGWLPPFRPGTGVHLCIAIAADRQDDLDEATAKVGDQAAACGCDLVLQELGETLPQPLTGHEHFGFKDGMSQPAVDGYDDPPQPNEPPAVAPGEFVLGYPCASGNPVAQAGSLWFNGSFAVFRRLNQDVAAFRAQSNAGVPASNPNLSPDQTAAIMMGRWPSGAPLELNPTSDPGTPGDTPNAFQYQAAPFSDNDGHTCPHFAHIRKANPRDETTPNPATDSPLLHRMIRRGIPFGPRLPPSALDDGQQRGLHFLSIVSDLDRQFEFVQRQWINDPNFPGGQPNPNPGPYGPPQTGTPDGPDPIAAEADTGTECTLIQPAGPHQFPVAKQLVKVTAGEYFFVPAISALAAIANGAAG